MRLCNCVKKKIKRNALLRQPMKTNNNGVGFLLLGSFKKNLPHNSAGKNCWHKQ